MKINEHMRYPHPVLSEYSSDYVSGEFKCSFEQQVTPDNELKIISSFELTSDELTSLIQNQKAQAGYFIVNRRTYFNCLQEAPLGKSEHFFRKENLYGTVLLRPVIWTLEDISGYSSPLVNAEFGQSVLLPKGSVIALSNEFKLSIDKRKFKPFESIFHLSKNLDTQAGMIVVEPATDKIIIHVNSELHKRISGIRGVPHIRDILMSSVYLPALVDVISQLQQTDSSLQSSKWYEIIEAKCVDLGLDLTSPSYTPLFLAQTLLKEPINTSLLVTEVMT